MAEHTIGNTGALRGVIPQVPSADDMSRAHFTNPESLCAYVESIKNRHAGQAWDNASRFRGTRDIGHAIELCRQGWPEGAAQAARLRDKINAANPVRRKLNAWDIGGAYPSVPRALAGNPVHMRSMRNVQRNRTITLIHHMGAPAGIEPSAMCNKAAVMAAIVDAVESADFQVELIGVSLVNAGRFYHETAFTVKDAGAPMDIGRMAFALGHVSMLRRLIFACRSGEAFNHPIHGNMGATSEYSEAPNGAYILPSIRHCEGHFGTEELAATSGLRFFIDALAKQGCPAFPQQEAA